MENISENERNMGDSKKTPANGDTFNEWVSKMGLSNDKISEKSKISNFYVAIAQGALEDETGKHPIAGEFDFIIVMNENLEIECFKRTILCELGRLEDEKLIRGVARVICQNKLSTDDAISYIRQFRTQKAKGDNVKLAKAIAILIEDYKFTHSDVNIEMIKSSLNLVLNAFSENYTT
jgi:hypothetical protein